MLYKIEIDTGSTTLRFNISARNEDKAKLAAIRYAIDQDMIRASQSESVTVKAEEVKKWTK